MTPEQRHRAGRAVEQRIKEMHATPTAVARAAGIDPKTVRALIRGDHWPGDAIQERLERVLRWRPGALQACSVRGSMAGSMEDLTDTELADELARRLRVRARNESRLRSADKRLREDMPHVRGNISPGTSAR